MKLFRKTRFKHLKKRNLFSYVTYILGEIILVVAGILIAVYINNVNEEKKHQKELENILSIIVSDLQDDIKEANQIILSEEIKESSYDKFFKNELTKEIYKSDYALRRLIFGFPEISFNKRGFYLLRDNINIDSSQDSILIKIMNIYTHQIDEVKADDELRKIEFQETYSHFKSQKWWFDYIEGITKRDTFNSDDFFEYVLKSEDYKNRVSSWYFINKFVFMPEIKVFVTEAQEIVDLIKNQNEY
ncbi:MAG: hypothetical protein JXQ93_05540 [Flavobacteriaceae bacterium]